MKTKKERIWKIAKAINLIRKALGYATKEQDINSEKRTIDGMIKELKRTKKGDWVETGGFRYTKTKPGIIIHPKFSFRIKLK